MPRSPHVLIVDDDEYLRLVLTRLVVRAWPQATITEALNGDEALSAVEAQPPDLIISDYQMPVMNGLELVRTLRTQGAAMPILVLSSEESVGEAFLAEGATHFLVKPFPMATLTHLLRTLLPDDAETRALGTNADARP